MKLSEAVRMVDINDPSTRGRADIRTFSGLFGIQADEWDEERFDKELVPYWFVKWFCTDIYAGGRVYYMDGEIVAVSWQEGRKCDEDVEFVSASAIAKVRDLVLSCAKESDFSHLLIDDMDQEVGIGYQVPYGSQVLCRECVHEPSGRKAEIVETFDGYDKVDDWDKVVVRFDESGKTEKVSLETLFFPFGK